jgi:hypothetical protein
LKKHTVNDTGDSGVKPVTNCACGAGWIGQPLP